MVEVTDDGLERVSDVALGNEDDEIHEVAVGIGTGNEGTGANSLANEVYRSNKNNGDCYFVETSADGDFEAHIEVTAGGSTANVTTSNPDENDITEIGVFFEGGQLLVIDEFTAVTIPSGHTEEFAVPVNITR